jgi:hypothetical protein
MNAKWNEVCMTTNTNWRSKNGNWRSSSKNEYNCQSKRLFSLFKTKTYKTDNSSTNLFVVIYSILDRSAWDQNMRQNRYNHHRARGVINYLMVASGVTKTKTRVCVWPQSHTHKLRFCAQDCGHSPLVLWPHPLRRQVLTQPIALVWLCMISSVLATHVYFLYMRPLAGYSKSGQIC